MSYFNLHRRNSLFREKKICDFIMIFQCPEDGIVDWAALFIGDFGYLRGVHLYFWLTVIVSMYIVTFVFMKRANAVEMVSQKWIFRSFGLIFAFMGVTRIMFVFAYFAENLAAYHQFLAWGYAFAAVALLPLIFTLEKWLIKWSKKFFSAVSVVLVILGFYFTIAADKSELSRTIQSIGMPVLAVSFIVLYGWIIKNSTGSVRKKSIFTMIGMVIFVAGILLDGETTIESVYCAGLNSLVVPMFYLSPIVFLIGMLVIVYSQKIS